jgi:hypothetical protein
MPIACLDNTAAALTVGSLHASTATRWMMKSRLLEFGLTAALMILPAFGAEVNRSWETLVETLKPGRKVVVVQHSRKQAEGKVLSLTNESITVQVGRQPLTVQRDDVFRVRIANIRRRNTLIGVAVAATIGAVIFGPAGKNNFNPGREALVGGILGAGAGAMAGGSLPIGSPLYEAPGGLKKSGE